MGIETAITTVVHDSYYNTVFSFEYLTRSSRKVKIYEGS